MQICTSRGFLVTAEEPVSGVGPPNVRIEIGNPPDVVIRVSIHWFRVWLGLMTNVDQQLRDRGL